MTGFPRMGGGGLHVADMLWGGLLILTWETADVISAFVAPALSGPIDTSLGQALARHPSIKEEQHIAALKAA